MDSEEESDHYEEHYTDTSSASNVDMEEEKEHDTYMSSASIEEM